MIDSEFINTLYEKESLSEIDNEFARFLIQLHPDITEPMLMAACLTSVAYRQGNVCILLDDYAGTTVFKGSENGAGYKIPALKNWIKILHASPVIGNPGDFNPLILDRQNRLYLHKLWQYEKTLAAEVLGRAQLVTTSVDKGLLKDGLKRLFADAGENPNWQQVAAVAAVYHRLTVISGGPGTGKTTTVARILALIVEQAEANDQNTAIALAAPTGKAAARMEESIITAKASLNVSKAIKNAIPEEAVTIHQLLGARRHSSAFRYNSENPLPFDTVIVDEASMVDQELMSKLTGALLENTRLILLGDKDQLASIEAGSVLGDLCGSHSNNQISSDMQERLARLSVPVRRENVREVSQPLTDNIILLKKNYRFNEGSGIGMLAKSINAGHAQQAFDILAESSFSDATMDEIDRFAEFEAIIAEQVTAYITDFLAVDTPEAKFKVYNRFCLLSAHRSGPWGVDYINARIERLLRKKGLIPPHDKWYAGKPVIINRNDYMLGLSNGDLGICMRDENGELKVFFQINDIFIDVWPSRLPDHSLSYALTVHKSQGSEFGNVLFVLPDKLSKVLSRELVYTAITRARQSVRIIGSKTVLAKAVERSAARNSGLQDRLWDAGLLESNRN